MFCFGVERFLTFNDLVREGERKYIWTEWETGIILTINKFEVFFKRYVAIKIAVQTFLLSYVWIDHCTIMFKNSENWPFFYKNSTSFMRMLVETPLIILSTNQIKASYCAKKHKLHFETKLRVFCKYLKIYKIFHCKTLK